jgi:hypothetical protein
MACKQRVWLLGVAACAALLAGCATSTPARPPVSQTAVGKSAGHVWTGVTEAEVAAALDRKFEEAARGYVKVKKDGEMMFCKRYRIIGSNIPTIQCITEAELRNQVENMDQYRDRMRTAAKCPHGPQGCSAL